jgi:hypothetical protein
MAVNYFCFVLKISRRRHWFFLRILMLLCLSFAHSQAETYYIDSQRAFDRLANAEFEPGDAIQFKKGSRFVGMFAPKGRGARGAVIQIGSYGTGDKPRIDAEGRHPAGLFINDPAFWEIDGLEITNTDGSDRDQGALFGIYALADKTEGIYEHFHISNCTIHHVNGMVGGKQKGGIHVHIKDLRESKFHNLRITHNHIYEVGGVGIGNQSSCGNVDVKGSTYTSQHLWTDVYVAHNFIDRTGRNNVIARVSKDAVYEYNRLANSSRASTGHSIFNFNTDGIKIQYNEAYGNVGEGGKDRGGFDADYNSANTYIQYNYSHGNLWFCGIMKRSNTNITIRYNVSINDQQGIYFYGFDKEEKVRNIHIYNIHTSSSRAWISRFSLKVGHPRIPLLKTTSFCSPEMGLGGSTQAGEGFRFITISTRG